MTEFVYGCMIVIVIVTFCDWGHKIYKNKDKIKKYLYNKI